MYFFCLKIPNKTLKQPNNWTVLHFVTNLLPVLFFYRFLFIPGSVHVLLCKVGQRLLCALQYHWLAISTSANILWQLGKVHTAGKIKFTVTYCSWYPTFAQTDRWKGRQIDQGKSKCPATKCGSIKKFWSRLLRLNISINHLYMSFW